MKFTIFSIAVSFALSSVTVYAQEMTKIKDEIEIPDHLRSFFYNTNTSDDVTKKLKGSQAPPGIRVPLDSRALQELRAQLDQLDQLERRINLSLDPILTQALKYYLRLVIQGIFQFRQLAPFNFNTAIVMTESYLMSPITA